MAKECRFGYYSIQEMRSCSPGKERKRILTDFGARCSYPVFCPSLFTAEYRDRQQTCCCYKKVHYTLPVASASWWIKQRSEKYNFYPCFLSKVCGFRQKVLWCRSQCKYQVWSISEMRGVKPDGVRHPTGEHSVSGTRQLIPPVSQAREQVW